MREKHHPNEQASHKEAKAGFESAKSRERYETEQPVIVFPSIPKEKNEENRIY